MITADKLVARSHRKLDLLARQVAGDPMLKDCRTPRCVSCSACRELSPLTRLPWAVLHARARGRPASRELEERRLVRDPDGELEERRLVRDPDVELLECEVTEARDRAFIKERDRQLAALAAEQAQWERAEAQRADRELVAAVAARRARAAEARRQAAEQRKRRRIAA